jgi:hypothetical protein
MDSSIYGPVSVLDQRDSVDSTLNGPEEQESSKRPPDREIATDLRVRKSDANSKTFDTDINRPLNGFEVHVDANISLRMT